MREWSGSPLTGSGATREERGRVDNSRGDGFAELISCRMFPTPFRLARRLR